MSSPAVSTDNDLDTIFIPPSWEQWQEAVLTGLSAESTLAALEHQTLDGLGIHVLYHNTPAAMQENVPQDTSGEVNTPWDNRLCIMDTTDTCLTNRFLHEGLQGGNTSIELHVEAASDIRALLKEVMLDLAPVSFRAGHDYAAVATQFLTLADQLPVKPETLRCSFNADPVGQWLKTGVEPDSMDTTLTAMARFSQEITAGFPCASTVLVDTTLHHNAGACSTQELQAAIATGTLYLTHMLDAGMSLDAASRCIIFQMACDSDVLMGSVKLRSLVALWQHVLEQFRSPALAGEPDSVIATPTIVAETSRRTLSRLDPWNNHLRNIAASTAAAMGGAATIIVHPHDRIGAWQAPTDPATGARIARNLPIILERESWVRHVQDPMAGSYAVETLTTQLTDLTWQALAEMGDLDAWLAIIRSGQWQTRLAQTQQQRSTRLSDEEQIMVGVNRYLSQEDTHASAATSELSTTPSHRTEDLSTALLPVRDAEPYERKLASIPGART